MREMSRLLTMIEISKKLFDGKLTGPIRSKSN